MTLEESKAICRVSTTTMLRLCQIGEVLADKTLTGWNIIALPFDRPALKPGEVAELIGVTPRYIERLCIDGDLRAVKLGKQWRIDHLSGMRFVNRRLQQAGLWPKPMLRRRPRFA